MRVTWYDWSPGWAETARSEMGSALVTVFGSYDYEALNNYMGFETKRAVRSY